MVGKIASMLKTWLDSEIITWESLYGICVLNEPFAIPGKRDNIWMTLRDDFYPNNWMTESLSITRVHTEQYLISIVSLITCPLCP